MRNRRDGTVEAVFSGPQEAVREIVARCHRGPPAARVERIEEQPELEPVQPGFMALPTR